MDVVKAQATLGGRTPVKLGAEQHLFTDIGRSENLRQVSCAFDADHSILRPGEFLMIMVITCCEDRAKIFLEYRDSFC